MNDTRAQAVLEGRRRRYGTLVLVLRADCGSCRYARRRRAGIGGVGSCAGGFLTLGDAIWEAVSVLLAVRAVGVEAYLGRDQGGKGAALDEAHLDGWGSISINCTGSAGGFAQGAYLGWQDDGSRWGRGWVRSSSPHSCEFLAAGIFRLAGASHFPELQHRHHGRRRRPQQHTTATMSAVSRSIGSRFLVPALRPSVTRAFAPAYRTYSTNEDIPHQHKTSSEDAPAVPLKSDSTQIRKENAAEGMRHAPDYNVAVDYRTSCVAQERNQSRAS
jgi:hypothetical protein